MIILFFMLPQNYRIIDCGQLKANTDYGINESDGTQDKYPPYPDDFDDLNEFILVSRIFFCYIH